MPAAPASEQEASIMHHEGCGPFLSSDAHSRAAQVSTPRVPGNRWIPTPQPGSFLPTGTYFMTSL